MCTHQNCELANVNCGICSKIFKTKHFKNQKSGILIGCWAPGFVFKNAPDQTARRAIVFKLTAHHWIVPIFTNWTYFGGDQILHFRQPRKNFLCGQITRPDIEISDLDYEQGYGFRGYWICILEVLSFSTRYGTSSNSQYSAVNRLLHLPEIVSQSHCIWSHQNTKKTCPKMFQRKFL